MHTVNDVGVIFKCFSRHELFFLFFFYLQFSFVHVFWYSNVKPLRTFPKLKGHFNVQKLIDIIFKLLIII